MPTIEIKSESDEGTDYRITECFDVHHSQVHIKSNLEPAESCKVSSISWLGYPQPPLPHCEYGCRICHYPHTHTHLIISHYSSNTRVINHTGKLSVKKKHSPIQPLLDNIRNLDEIVVLPNDQLIAIFKRYSTVEIFVQLEQDAPLSHKCAWESVIYYYVEEYYLYLFLPDVINIIDLSKFETLQTIKHNIDPKLLINHRLQVSLANQLLLTAAGERENLIIELYSLRPTHEGEKIGSRTLKDFTSYQGKDLLYDRLKWDQKVHQAQQEREQKRKEQEMASKRQINQREGSVLARSIGAGYMPSSREQAPPPLREKRDFLYTLTAQGDLITFYTFQKFVVHHVYKLSSDATINLDHPSQAYLYHPTYDPFVGRIIDKPTPFNLDQAYHLQALPDGNYFVVLNHQILIFDGNTHTVIKRLHSRNEDSTILRVNITSSGDLTAINCMGDTLRWKNVFNSFVIYSLPEIIEQYLSLIPSLKEDISCSATSSKLQTTHQPSSDLCFYRRVPNGPKMISKLYAAIRNIQSVFCLDPGADYAFGNTLSYRGVTRNGQQSYGVRPNYDTWAHPDFNPFASPTFSSSTAINPKKYHLNSAQLTTRLYNRVLHHLAYLTGLYFIALYFESPRVTVEHLSELNSSTLDVSQRMEDPKITGLYIFQLYKKIKEYGFALEPRLLIMILYCFLISLDCDDESLETSRIALKKLLLQTSDLRTIIAQILNDRPIAPHYKPYVILLQHFSRPQHYFQNCGLPYLDLRSPHQSAEYFESHLYDHLLPLQFQDCLHFLNSLPAKIILFRNHYLVHGWWEQGIKQTILELINTLVGYLNLNIEHLPTKPSENIRKHLRQRFWHLQHQVRHFLAYLMGLHCRKILDCPHGWPRDQCRDESELKSLSCIYPLYTNLITRFNFNPKQALQLLILYCFLWSVNHSSIIIRRNSYHTDFCPALCLKKSQLRIILKEFLDNVEFPDPYRPPEQNYTTPLPGRGLRSATADSNLEDRDSLQAPPLRITDPLFELSCQLNDPDSFLQQTPLSFIEMGACLPSSTTLQSLPHELILTIISFIPIPLENQHLLIALQQPQQ